MDQLDKETEESLNETLDFLYEMYLGEIGMQLTRYVHPMFYNGTYSKNNEVQPPKPDEELSFVDFQKKILDNPEHKDHLKWSHTFQMLFIYINRKKRK